MAVPLVHGEVFGECVRAPPGVVHEDVDAGNRFERVAYRHVYAVFGGDVADNRVRSTSRLLDAAGNGGHAVGIEVNEHDGRALRRQASGDGAANVAPLRQ